MPIKSPLEAAWIPTGSPTEPLEDPFDIGAPQDSHEEKSDTGTVCRVPERPKASPSPFEIKDTATDWIWMDGKVEIVEGRPPTELSGSND